MLRVIMCFAILLVNAAAMAETPYCPQKWANMVTIEGSDTDDIISLYDRSAHVSNRHGTYRFTKLTSQRWRVLAGRGDDNVVIQDVNGAQVCLGAGNDSARTIGPTGRNFLYGEDGNDQIVGGTNNDVIYGGNGDDAIRGGDGDDSIAGQVGNDYIKGEGGNDSLTGGTGNDYIRGGSGSDSLYGQSGDDTLIADETGWNEVDIILDGGSGYDLCYRGENNYRNCEVEVD